MIGRSVEGCGSGISAASAYGHQEQEESVGANIDSEFLLSL
jgi:hypothetical protein